MRLESRVRAAGVLADLAKERGPGRKAIVSVGGIAPLIELLQGSHAGARRHAACVLWGLTLGDTPEATEHQRQVSAAGAVPPLVSLLQSDKDEAYGYAVATLAHLAQDREAGAPIAETNALEQLAALTSGPPSWLQTHVRTMFMQLGVELPAPTEPLPAGRSHAEATDKHQRIKGKRTRRGEPPLSRRSSDSPRKPPAAQSSRAVAKHGSSSRETGAGGASHRSAKAGQSLAAHKPHATSAHKPPPSARAKEVVYKEPKALKGNKSARPKTVRIAEADAPAAD